MSTISGHTVRASGTILTAAIYNADHLNHITNALALNADKVEGATPPVTAGNAVVFKDASGAAFEDFGDAPVSETDFAANNVSIAASIATRVAKTGDTMSGALTTVGLKWTMATQLAPSTDLNSVTDSGFYDGQTLTNAPDTGWWYILVQRHSNNANFVVQTAWELDTPSNDVVHIRWRRSGTWTDWRRVITSLDLADETTARAGTDNAKWMSALRTAQAIETLAKAVNMPTAAQSFSSSGAYDTGIVAATARCAFIIKRTSGSSGAPQVSVDGGTTYTTFNTGIGSSTSDSILLFVDGANGRFAALGVAVTTTEGGAVSDVNFALATNTLTKGAGNVKFISTNANTWSALRIMG